MFGCVVETKPLLGGFSQNFLAIEKGQLEGRVSAISFDTMFYILRSGIGSAKAQTELKRLRKHIHVSAVDAVVVDRALNAGWIDFEDTLQYYCAEFGKCTALITRNKRDYPDNTNLPVFTPVEFISSSL